MKSNSVFLCAALALLALANRKSKQNSAAIGATGAGEFGTIYTQFRHKGKEAILHLMKVQEGECVGALHRTDIGDIDLVWGRVTSTKKHSGYGLAHIIDKHGTVITYNSLKFNIEDFIPLVIQFGEKDEKRTTKEKLVFGGYGFRFVVRLNFFGKKKKWLLTAFDVQ